MARSELLMVRLFWYLELPNSSKLAAPVPCSGNIDTSVRRRRQCAASEGTRWWRSVAVSSLHSISHSNKCHYCTLLIIVVRSPPLSSGFWASPTLEGSLRAFSLEKVLHSEPTSITRSPDRQTLQRWKIKSCTKRNQRTFESRAALDRKPRAEAHYRVGDQLSSSQRKVFFLCLSGCGVCRSELSEARLSSPSPAPSVIIRGLIPIPSRQVMLWCLQVTDVAHCRAGQQVAPDVPTADGEISPLTSTTYTVDVGTLVEQLNRERTSLPIKPSAAVKFPLPSDRLLLLRRPIKCSAASPTSLAFIRDVVSPVWNSEQDLPAITSSCKWLVVDSPIVLFVHRLKHKPFVFK